MSMPGTTQWPKWYSAREASTRSSGQLSMGSPLEELPAATGHMAAHSRPVAGIDVDDVGDPGERVDPQPGVNLVAGGDVGSSRAVVSMASSSTLRRARTRPRPRVSASPSPSVAST